MTTDGLADNDSASVGAARPGTVANVEHGSSRAKVALASPTTRLPKEMTA